MVSSPGDEDVLQITADKSLLVSRRGHVQEPSLDELKAPFDTGPGRRSLDAEAPGWDQLHRKSDERSGKR
jgi:hypothetical protein